MKEQILNAIFDALDKLDIKIDDSLKSKINVTSPDPKLGDYATNVGLILAKLVGKKPQDISLEVIGNLDHEKFESIEVAGVGFINFRLKDEILLELLASPMPAPAQERDQANKILLEYFQPNIAKPLHIGHVRTAVIGDALKRMHLFQGFEIESDTHMGDWGTQFGFLIRAYKEDPKLINEIYVRLNSEASENPKVLELAKEEFVKLERGDKDNREIWEKIVNESIQKFLSFAESFDLLPFDHHWPESFYETRMPAVLNELKAKNLLVESQGAQIVNLEKQNLGVAVIVKSDGGTTYLLRDLAGFLFGRKEGFAKHLYVVDNRQSHHYHQLFAILKLMGEMKDSEGHCILITDL
jgi:arginyl-tRNA synthetase